MDGLNGIDISALLPPSLLLPPRLSAHKYIMVCTLTIAAWDTLVLSPRTWKLMKTSGWPFLKITYHVLRYLMPLEFTIVAVAFFDSKWTPAACSQFYLFEPILTLILMTVASASIAVRLSAIFDRYTPVTVSLGGLLFVQLVCQAICCAFYRVVPLEQGQGCIAGPQANWVGLYWLAPTVFYTVALILAVIRSVKYQASKPVNWWKLALRDSLHLYAAIWIVNVINVLFWFIVTPTGPSDPIKTINTSITAVLTTTMTLRIILSVKGTLESGGLYSGAFSNTGSSNPGSKHQPQNIQHQLSSHNAHGTGHRHSTSQQNNVSGYTIDQIQAKGRDWARDGGSDDGKSGYEDAPGFARSPYGEKATLEEDDPAFVRAKAGGIGVKVNVDRDRNFN